MSTQPEPHDEVDDERCIAALLAPAHAQAQFEALWVRIAANDLEKARRVPVAHRLLLSFAALAATLLMGAGIGWYQRASAPSYATLGESARHTCRPAPLQDSAAAPQPSPFVEVKPPPRSAPYTGSLELANSLCAPELR